MHRHTKALRLLIVDLQCQIHAGGLRLDQVNAAISRLAEIDPRYRYDDDKFPALAETGNWNKTIEGAPTSLAEALLWKLGKWKSYQLFANHYSNGQSVQGPDDVVFYAFAKHLVNNNDPIYDQHALRAVWAICPSVSANESAQCRQWLVKKNGKWKENGSGKTASACYTLFKTQIRQVARPEVDFRILDRLLMPLGQAIKKCTPGGYFDFESLRSIRSRTDCDK